MNYLEISILFFFILFLILFYISNYIYNKFIIDQKTTQDEEFMNDAMNITEPFSRDTDVWHCQSYINRYPDLQRAFGKNCRNWHTRRRGWWHWNAYGKREQRNPGKYDQVDVDASKKELEKAIESLKEAEEKLEEIKKKNDSYISQMNNNINDINAWDKERQKNMNISYRNIRYLDNYIRNQRWYINDIRKRLNNINGDIRNRNSNINRDSTFAAQFYELDDARKAIDQYIESQVKEDNDLNTNLNNMKNRLDLN